MSHDGNNSGCKESSIGHVPTYYCKLHVYSSETKEIKYLYLASGTMEKALLKANTLIGLCISGYELWRSSESEPAKRDCNDLPFLVEVFRSKLIESSVGSEGIPVQFPTDDFSYNTQNNETFFNSVVTTTLICSWALANFLNRTGGKSLSDQITKLIIEDTTMSSYCEELFSIGNFSYLSAIKV